MESPNSRKALSADMTGRGVVITFADGRSALFTGELLHTMLPEAEDLSRELQLWMEKSRRGPVIGACCTARQTQPEPHSSASKPTRRRCAHLSKGLHPRIPFRGSYAQRRSWVSCHKAHERVFGYENRRPMRRTWSSCSGSPERTSVRCSF